MLIKSIRTQLKFKELCALSLHATHLHTDAGFQPQLMQITSNYRKKTIVLKMKQKLRESVVLTLNT